MKLIIERAVGPLVPTASSSSEIGGRIEHEPPAAQQRMDELSELDPASRILELKICDPAMGSGPLSGEPCRLDGGPSAGRDRGCRRHCRLGGQDAYVSPLDRRIATIRSRIEKRAKEHNWPVPDASSTTAISSAA